MRKSKIPTETSMNMFGEKPDHISYSQITSYLRCPHEWALGKLFGAKQPQTSAQGLGITVHDALFRCWQEYEKVGDLDEMVIQDIWQMVNNDCEVLEQPLPLGAYADGLRFILEAIFSGKLDFSTTIFAEYEFGVQFGSAKVVGRIDRVDDLGDGNYLLVDYKSGMGMPTEESLLNDLQSLMYAAAWRKVAGSGVSSICVRVHNVRWNYTQEREVTSEEMDLAIQYVDDVWQRIQNAQSFLPTPGEGCLAFGGCWAASLCPRQSLASLRGAGGTDKDISTMTPDELVDLYHTMEVWHPRVRKLLREQVIEQGEILLSDGRKIGLKHTVTKKENKEVVSEFMEIFQDFIANPVSVLRLDSKSIERSVDSIAANIRRSEDLDMEEQQSLLETLNMMTGRLQGEKPGTPKIIITNTKGEKHD